MKTLEQIKKDMVESLEPSFIKCNASISVYDFNAFTIQELICQLFTKMNEVIKQSNKYTSLITDVLNWVQNEGLKDEVNKVLESWKTDGTMDNIVNENIFNNIQSKLSKLVENDKDLNEKIIDLKNKDSEIDEEIETINGRIDLTRKDLTGLSQVKVFMLRNQDNEFISDNRASDEELSCTRVETDYIMVEYKRPFPINYKPGAVVGQCFAYGNNKWDVRIKDVNNDGFKFCLVDSTTGLRVNNTEPVNAVYATHINFIHISSSKLSEGVK